jgi:hypothetical protein
LQSRISRLELLYMPEAPGPWPPAEGSFSWCLFTELGKPVERMSFWEMYHEVARRTFADET